MTLKLKRAFSPDHDAFVEVLMPFSCYGCDVQRANEVEHCPDCDEVTSGYAAVDGDTPSPIILAQRAKFEAVMSLLGGPLAEKDMIDGFFGKGRK